MWGCVHTTGTQRIRTTTKFAGPSGGHSENAFCSSVTKVAELIRSCSKHHSPLTITGETLCLSIDSEKYTVAFLQHMVTCSSVFCPQSLTDRKFEKKPTDRSSCHVRPDVSLTSADVRPQVTWRSWRSCGKYNSLKICLILFKFCAPSSSRGPRKKGMSRTPLPSIF